MPICSLALISDFYELTMAAAYYDHGMNGIATFSLFVRDISPQRGFIVVAGIEEVLDFLENFSFTKDELEYLSRLDYFSSDFLDFLSNISFTGEVWAMPEGSICFAEEPILEITAPIIEAQLVETRIINLINLHSMLASKAARCVLAAKGRILVDFGLRRTQGQSAGMAAAEAAALVGFAGTSNIAAACKLGFTSVGTMAHSFINCFSNEIDSFRAFATTFPDHTILLVDTYNSIVGLKRAIAVATEMKKHGYRLVGIRLDSGDMISLSRQAWKMLKHAALEETMIVVSGSLDEYFLAEMLAQGAQVDLFAVGTKVVCSSDAPYFNIAYKLVNYENRPTLKLSEGKRSLVSPKQVWRYLNMGMLDYDLLGLRGEYQIGRTLLFPMMFYGRRSRSRENWRQARQRFQKELAILPENSKYLVFPKQPSVLISSALQELQKETEVLVAK